MRSARDVMTKELITVSADSSASDAIHTLLNNEISGAPVVDNEDQLVGIISEFQLLAVIYDESMKRAVVGELMSKEVISVNEETPLPQIADQLIARRIRRLPVVRGKRLVGLVSRRDLLRFAVNTTSQVFEPHILKQLAGLRVAVAN